MSVVLVVYFYVWLYDSMNNDSRARFLLPSLFNSHSIPYADRSKMSTKLSILGLIEQNLDLETLA